MKKKSNSFNYLFLVPAMRHFQSVVQVVATKMKAMMKPPLQATTSVKKPVKKTSKRLALYPTTSLAGPGWTETLEPAVWLPAAPMPKRMGTFISGAELLMGIKKETHQLPQHRAAKIIRDMATL
jgi:hypothetical protein